VPRIARIVVPGVLHHVTQRGNNRQDVFLTDDDRLERELGFSLETRPVGRRRRRDQP
jgi:REP element-mobilizing transposase RayT